MVVFHHIGAKTDFTNPLDEILAYQGDISFDGVYEEVFTHRLELAPKKPLLFVSGNTIGREGFCNREQLLELKRLGFKLGWHGWSHRKLTELAEAEIDSELHPPDWLRTEAYAYPHGDFNELAVNIVKRYFNKAYSTTQGDDDRFSLRREYI